MWDWQDVAVFVIVAGAVLFLARRMVSRRRARTRPAESFVPLEALRTPKAKDCH